MLHGGSGAQMPLTSLLRLQKSCEREAESEQARIATANSPRGDGDASVSSDIAGEVRLHETGRMAEVGSPIQTL